jgi:hypothetical protein
MPGGVCVMKDNSIECGDNVITTIPASPSLSPAQPPSSPFQRFTNSVRKSFSRIRISRKRKPLKSKRNISDKDYVTTTDDDDEIQTARQKQDQTTRQKQDVDCESVDSGLETDHSSDLTPSSKTREYNINEVNNTKSCLRKYTGLNNGLCPAPPQASSNRSSSYYPDSLLSSSASSANIDRKSSGRSNHTIDSGILVNNNKRSPPSRNLRFEDALPKKRVSILLPERPGVQQARLVRSPGGNTQPCASSSSPRNR